MRVDLDARLELLGAVSWLEAAKSTGAPDALAVLPYSRELTGRLPAPSDPALAEPLTGFDRARLALSLSPLPDLQRLDPDDANAGPAAAESLDRRLAALRAYAHDAKFEAAFNASRYLLDAEAARLRPRLAAAAPLRALEAYTGLKGPERAAVLLSPFADPGPAPAQVELSDDGTASLTVVVGPGISTASPSHLDFWSDRLPEALWNDAAHLQLEPLLSLYARRVGQSSKLAGSDARCAESWRRCAGELLARAVTIRLAARRAGAAAAAGFRKRLEGGKRNPALTALLASLKRYEDSRRGGKAAGLDAYFPELLAALPLDDPAAAPAPPSLPPASGFSPRRRRRLAAFLKAAARRTGDPRLKGLAAAAPAWARASESARSAPEPDDLRRRGLEDFAAGRFEIALADFRAALSSAPDDAQTLASEAAVLATLGRDDDALAAYKTALASARSAGSPGPLVPDLLSSRATILARRGLAARAAADLEAALHAAAPDWPRREEAAKRLAALKARAHRQ